MACHERQWLIPKQPLKYDIRHIGEGTIGTDFSNNTISSNATACYSHNSTIQKASYLADR